MPRLFPLLAVAAAGCAAFAPAQSGRWPAPPYSNLSHHGSYLQITGIGKPDPKFTGMTQRRSTSRDAAILDARARLADYVSRIMIADGVSVGERATADAAWRRKLDLAVAGIEVVETRWDDSDTAAVVLQAEKDAILRALELEE